MVTFVSLLVYYRLDMLLRNREQPRPGGVFCRGTARALSGDSPDLPETRRAVKPTSGGVERFRLGLVNPASYRDGSPTEVAEGRGVNYDVRS